MSDPGPTPRSGARSILGPGCTEVMKTRDYSRPTVGHADRTEFEHPRSIRRSSTVSPTATSDVCAASECKHGANLSPLFVYCFLKCFDFREYVIKGWRIFIKHHGCHGSVVRAKVLDPRLVRQELQRSWAGGIVISPAGAEERGFVPGDLREKLKVHSGDFAVVGIEEHGEIVIVP